MHTDRIAAEDEQQKLLSKRYNEEIIKNARLMEENSRFRCQIEETKQRKSKSPTYVTDRTNAPPENVSPPTEPNRAVSNEKYRHLADKFNDLHKKHQEISSRLNYVERKNVVVMQKNKEMKESVAAWQKYSDRHSAKKRIKHEELVENDPLKAVGPNEDQPYLEGDISSGSLEQLPELRAEASGVVQMANVKDVSSKAVSCLVGEEEKLTSSQTTEDEIITQNARTMMLPPSLVENDDNPEFVSAKSLKRKRASPSIKQAHTDRIPSDGTPMNPFRVKEEPPSSPPVPKPSLQLLRTETVDLDELGPNIISTPRRRQIQPTNSTLTNTLQTQRSMSDPPIKKEIIKDMDLVECETSRKVIRRPSNPSPSLGEPRAYSEPSDPRRDTLQPLQTLDPNVQTPGREEEQLSRAKRLKRGNAQRLDAYQRLTESGDEPPPMNENDAKLAPDLARASFNKRLRALKGTQTPAKTPSATSERLSALQVPTPPSSARSAVARYVRRSPNESSKQDQPSASRTTNTADSRPAWPATHKPSLPKPQDRQPLRSKTVSELKLSDFKANPKYNQGYSYAFTETVRNRSDRACLPGCVRPECCGSTFRTLASVAPPLSPSAEEALLQDYLGDAYNIMSLTQMSREEREELVLQARTRELAKKHGRHKHAYERPATPPGFWRVDFPTTQEHEEDRRKAAETEKKLVGERRAEALRKGGRWIFRDE
jgi:hypothetical protein